MIDIEVRDVTNIDLEKVMEIENSVFVSPWKKEDIIREINDNQFAKILVVTINEQVVGFMDYWVTFDSATICQIGIHPNYQRQGLGSKLMDEAIKDCYAKRAKTITLEVRANNVKAINFYKKYGFKIALIKEAYYSNGEDAIYMIKEVNINE